jgi:geranylgeranyl pyrophosphate synthase
MLPQRFEKPMLTRVSRVEPSAIELLPEVYELLSDVVKTPAVHGDYGRTLLRVLDAAQLSEKEGVSLTLLPLLACQAAGGSPKRAIPVAAAWRALHIAAKLLDDVEDGALTLLPLDPASVLNVATGFIALANLALARLARDYDEVDKSLWYSLQIEGRKTILRMAGGQDADLSHAALDLEHYFQIMADKSGSHRSFGAALVMYFGMGKV